MCLRQPGEVPSISLGARSTDHKARAVVEGPENLPYRDVESWRCLEQCRTAVVERVLALHPDDIRHQKWSRVQPEARPMSSTARHRALASGHRNSGRIITPTRTSGSSAVGIRHRSIADHG